MKVRNKIKKPIQILAIVPLFLLTQSCAQKAENDTWQIDSQEEWQMGVAEKSNFEITDGKIVPTAVTATFKSTLKKFKKKQSVKSITFSQSPEWLNWET